MKPPMKPLMLGRLVRLNERSYKQVNDSKCKRWRILVLVRPVKVKLYKQLL